jgi:hypothetical protein
MKPPHVDYRGGLAAILAADRNAITCTNSKIIDGSMYLDDLLAGLYPGCKTWDYGIGVTRNARDVLLFVEVHPAHTSHVSEVIEKHETLQRWLRGHGKPLAQVEHTCVWVASGPTRIPNHAPQVKLLAKHGLRSPRKVVVLDDYA